MKAIKNTLLLAATLTLAIVFYKVTLVIVGVLLVLIVLVIVFAYLQHQANTNKRNRFLKENTGKYFLWYSSNKKLLQGINQYLIPQMTMNYQAIYNNKNTLQHTLSSDQIKYLELEVRNKKLPLVIKITDKKIAVESFYNELFQLKKGRINGSEYDKKIMFKFNKLENE